MAITTEQRKVIKELTERYVKNLEKRAENGKELKAKGVAVYLSESPGKMRASTRNCAWPSPKPRRNGGNSPRGSRP